MNQRKRLARFRNAVQQMQEKKQQILARKLARGQGSVTVDSMDPVIAAKRRKPIGSTTTIRKS